MRISVRIYIYFVLTAKTTKVAEKVKFPNLGTDTPFPFLNYLAMYDPKPCHIELTVFSSRVFA